MEDKNRGGKKISKKFFLILALLCIILVIVFIIGVIVFSRRDDKVVYKNENGGEVLLNYSTNSNKFVISNVSPITNVVGISSDKEGQYFDFAIEVNLDKAESVDYEVSIEKIATDCSISDDDIRIYLESEDSGTYTKVFEPIAFKPLKEFSEIGTDKGKMVLVKSKKKASGVDNYRLRMWLADSSLTSTGSYGVVVSVKGKVN